MSMRALWMAISLAGLLGCPVSEEDPQAEASFAPTAKLRIDGDQVLNVLPAKREQLSVQYVDANEQPVAGKWVEFGLTGSPEGASLELARAQTDRDGIATTTLVAGRAATEFEVRASADGLEPQYFTITVSSAKEPTVVVSVSYAGQRAIDSTNVLVVEGMVCDQLRSNATDTRMSSSWTLDKNDPTTTLPLGAGRSYAIAAWASDSTNSKLAWGCKDYKAPVDRESPKDLTIELEDIVFTASTAIPLNFSIDASESLSALAPLARSVVTQALPKTNTPQASFLLDALQSKVNLASTRSGLDAALQQLLEGASAGPLRFADALAGAVAEDGATCLLQGLLTPVGPAGVSTFSLLPYVYAVPAGSVVKDVSPSDVPFKGVSEFSASYDASLAELNVKTLQISLGFGSYAAYVSKAFGEPAASYNERVTASTGCAELGALVAAQPASFAGISEKAAVDVCFNALAGLVLNIRSAWMSLDAQRSTLSLSDWKLAAHDRDGDKKIDDLGPASPTATWSLTGAASTPETAVKANVRMSPVIVSARGAP
jgi:hypothetical protein